MNVQNKSEELIVSGGTIIFCMICYNLDLSSIKYSTSTKINRIRFKSCSFKPFELEKMIQETEKKDYGFNARAFEFQCCSICLHCLFYFFKLNKEIFQFALFTLK